MKIVLDTNVIISARLDEKSHAGIILSLALEETLELLVSREILKEYEDVLKRTKFDLSSKRTARLVSKIKRNSVIIKPQIKINKIKDEADNKFLECAFSGGADFLVTGNKKHFCFESFRGIKIVGPNEFIRVIGRELIE